MLKKYHYLLLFVLLFSCTKDRDKIFELTYLNLEFEIPAGFAGIGGEVMLFEFTEIPTLFEEQLLSHNVNIEDIGGIFPYRAQIRSLDGSDYYFIRNVYIRLCSTDNTDCLIESDDLFYVQGLNGGADDKINLLSGLQNREELLSSESFRLEIVMSLNPGQITPSNITSFLDMTFEVVR